MGKGWLKRWAVMPLWWKLIPVVGLVIALSWFHFRYYPQRSELAYLLESLFFLPLFMASLLFGLRGGLICAGVLSLNFLPWPLEGWAQAYQPVESALRAGLLLLTGTITGALVDRERREARLLKASEELALLGRAAATVAHELKNPLVAIGGFAHQIQRDLAPDHPHGEKLRIIVGQVAHMEHMLREMLEYSRPLELNLEHLSLADLIAEALAMCSLQAEQSKVRLEVGVAPDSGRPLLDGSRIKQVVLNLLQNAVQASAEGGLVRIKASNQGSEVRLEVIDQGKGIASQDLDKVFQPFFTTKQQGTGLGLAVSRKIVEAHGGHMEVASSQDKGTTFTVIMPARN